MKKVLFTVVLLAAFVAPLAVHAQDGDGLPEGFAEFVTEDEQFAFLYPEDWYAAELAPGALLTNSESLTAYFEDPDAEDYELAEGEIGVLMYFVPQEWYDAELPEDASLEELLTAVVEFETGGEEAGYKLGDLGVDSVELDEGELVVGAVKFEDDGEEGYIYVAEMNDDGLLFVAWAIYPPGEADADEQVTNILGTVNWTYTAEQVDEIWTSLEEES